MILVFENLWKKGIDIEDRIKEIEKGYNFTMETISNSIESLEIFERITSSVKEEMFDYACIFLIHFSN